MERINRNELNLRIAYLISQRATCQRLGVGAIITRDNRIVATGYNGPVKGSPHCSILGCDTSEHCQHAVHAEANAIYFAARYGVSLEGCTLYVTHSPCRKCAEAIVNAGIDSVIYDIQFRDTSSLKFLTSNGVGVSQHILNNNEEKL
jgi:dCMP deaminase